MTKIIGIIQPFDKQQHFYVYQDGNKIESLSFTIDQINETLFSLCQKYNTNIVNLSAPHRYLQGVINSIKKAEYSKYSKNNLDIKII